MKIPLFKRIFTQILLLLVLLSPLHGIDPFVVITPEKTGTHLLMRALDFLTEKQPVNIWDRAASNAEIHLCLDKAKLENKYFHMHAYWLPNIRNILQKEKYKIIFLLRDPRDQLISLLYFIRVQKWEYNKDLRMKGEFGTLSMEDQIEEMITGKKYGKPVPKVFIQQRLGWMHEENVYTTYFESLVGEKGGGNDALQFDELKRICVFLNIDLSTDEIRSIQANLFGQTGMWTFRKGQIGSWKSHFTEKHKQLFKEYWGQLLIDLGYESDLNW